MHERRIDDYWNIDGSRDLSDSWTGFTLFTLLDEKPPNGYLWSGERLTRKQLTSRPDYLWPELWRTRNSSRPSRMLARNWKRQWLLLCLARQARKESMVRRVAKPMRSNQNLRVFWKPVNPQDCVWKNLYRIIMRTILQEKGTIHCNIKTWYTNLFLCLKP